MGDRYLIGMRSSAERGTIGLVHSSNGNKRLPVGERTFLIGSNPLRDNPGNLR